MSERKVFSDSVVPLPEQPGLTANGLMVHAIPARRDETMTLLFSLQPPPETRKRLEEQVASGKGVPPAELAASYGADKADLDKLEAWLKDHGFEIVDRSPGNLGIYARASAGTIENALQVQMTQVTKGGVTYTAARDAPSLPVEVAGGVRAIVGLQPFRKANKHAIKRPPKDGNRVGMLGGDGRRGAGG
jgi:kumamolisin